MKKWVLISFILVVFPSPVHSQKASIIIGLADFQDRSGYNGEEKVAEKIPLLLGKKLIEVNYYQIVLPDSLQQILESQKTSTHDLYHNTSLVKTLEHFLDAVIMGEVEDFNLSRFSVGNPLLGGYSSYKGNVKLKIKLYRTLDGRLLLETEQEGVETERDVDVTFLGKPTKRMLEFWNFRKLHFESEEFNKTIIGKATNRVLTQLVEKIKEVLKPPTPFLPRKGLSEPCVLMVVPDGVYVNIGSEDGVKLGDKFVIYAKQRELRDPKTGAFLGYIKDKIGVIQIIQIESTHLSKARILEGKDLIQVGDKVKVE